MVLGVVAPKEGDGDATAVSMRRGAEDAEGVGDGAGSVAAREPCRSAARLPVPSCLRLAKLLTAGLVEANCLNLGLADCGLETPYLLP